MDHQDWVGMQELRPGETLLLAGPALSPSNGPALSPSKGSQTATAASVRIEHLATPVTVYNFEVADWHTYHVGTPQTGWVFVHNLCNIGAVNKLKALKAEAKTPGTELYRLANRQATQAGDVVQYALVATRNGRYPVMAHGFSKPVGNVVLKVGDVWKYGQTKNPGTRYTQAWLDRMGLKFDPQQRGLSLSHRRQVEQAQIDLYRLDHGSLPPGNKIRR